MWRLSILKFNLWTFFFFPFQKVFLQQNENISKTNNTKKQLHESNIKITIAKIHSHRKKNMLKIKQKKPPKKQKKPSSTILPPQEKRGHPQHPRRSFLRQQSRNRAVNCCRKDPHPRGCRYPRFSSFLCKCNLTKC